jgi:hypothetical protein
MGFYENAVKLRAEVDRQLLEDLRHYGIDPPGLQIAWSQGCQEGHCVEFLDGTLESDSEVGVRRRQVDCGGLRPSRDRRPDAILCGLAGIPAAGRDAPGRGGEGEVA